ncbi:hypothetical protein BDB00DRAFT_827514 [Zychaea mexicana]|uniref:uncharacterized protein n=1 Tax=Zychaea mexicana TaxID=64656 RepID=UPI0022FED1E2|nr:uncharacterized protein BDB00DRAFT_827514 [Zychaea mexicana]KAI9492646.1 hypothetical protein BDB00DRAFT_827514 [Zychaea mexicana]
MQPAEPMGVPLNKNQNNNQEIPEHIPAQMALAPEQRPYEQTHTIRRQDFEDDGTHRNSLAKHSLSPEQLGVVGYVKDVAGFVKDAVQERRVNKKANKASASLSSSPPPSEERRGRVNGSRSNSSNQAPASPAISSSPEGRESTPLAEAVTSLFPGLDPSAAGCSHADELRHDLMRTHSRDSNDSSKLLNE